MWDNRETKKSPKQPDYKCKNKSCDKAVWLNPKGSSAPVANGKPPVSGAPLAAIYGEAVEIASRALHHYLGKDVLAADIVAGAATLFIQAAQTGRPIKAPVKTAPPPPPPPPKPEPEPEPDYSNAADLPF
jgi:hypothetical protein